ncbi:MAG TPA: FAD-dependent monooxygenase [Cytophagaceae bacterium]
MKGIILGGGIAGLTTAIALNKIGIEASIYEKAPQVRAVGAGLVLGANAVMILQKLGIAEDILQAGKILSRLCILDEFGKVITETDSIRVSKKYGTDNFAIHRVDLHMVLQKYIEGSKIVTGKECIRVAETDNGVTVHFADGTTEQADFLVAADGIHSNIRKQFLPSSLPRYAGYTCWRAVIDREPAGFDNMMFSETWGRNGRFGIVPLANNKIYWFACVNSAPDKQSNKTNSIRILKDSFSKYHSPINEIIDLTRQEEILWGDIIDLKPIKQFAFGKTVLIGDAAHATTPNMGQGACQAIEDAYILASCFTQEKNIHKAFRLFESKRIQRTTTIVNRSWSLGKIAQWENPLACKIRNSLIRAIPASYNEKQMEFLYKEI